VAAHLKTSKKNFKSTVYLLSAAIWLVSLWFKPVVLPASIDVKQGMMKARGDEKESCEEIKNYFILSFQIALIPIRLAYQFQIESSF
jgi:hypothetical protein